MKKKKELKVAGYDSGFHKTYPRLMHVAKYYYSRMDRQHVHSLRLLTP